MGICEYIHGTVSCVAESNSGNNGAGRLSHPAELSNCWSDVLSYQAAWSKIEDDHSNVGGEASGYGETHPDEWSYTDVLLDC